MSGIRLVNDTLPCLLPMRGRSPGRHVSAVIHDLCVSLGHYEPRTDGADDASTTRMELGNTFEYARILMLHESDPGRYVQPGELCRDGMYGTPDLFDAVMNVVCEMKFTWISAKHEPDSDKFWRYWVQIMAYCQMMGVMTGRLYVCHVRGKYDGDGPVYREWERTFSAYELAKNWSMLMTRANSMEWDDES